MTRFRFWGIAAVAIVAILATVAARYYLGDRREILRQLTALADTASVNGAETDIERLGRVARVGGFFTEDVVIRRSEDNSAFVGGRRAVAALAGEAAAQQQTMKVSIDDIDITIEDQENATANMTVVVSRNSPEAESVDLRQVTATLRKVNGTWLISQARVQPARPASP